MSRNAPPKEWLFWGSVAWHPKNEWRKEWLFWGSVAWHPKKRMKKRMALLGERCVTSKKRLRGRLTFKGTQDSSGFWIPHRVFGIPRWCWYSIPFSLKLELGFQIPIVSGILDSLSYITESGRHGICFAAPGPCYFENAVTSSAGNWKL